MLFQNGAHNCATTKACCRLELSTSHTCCSCHRERRELLIRARNVPSLDYFADDLPPPVRVQEEEGAGFRGLSQHSQSEIGASPASSPSPPLWRRGGPRGPALWHGAPVDARLGHGGDVPRLGERRLDLQSVTRQTLEDVPLAFFHLEH